MGFLQFLYSTSMCSDIFYGSSSLMSLVMGCDALATPMIWVKVQVKESRNRPGVAQSVPGGLGSQISLHSAREGGEW
jgi:hypothetical protein